MTQENTKRVEIDVLALLHKLWSKKVFILFTAFYVAVFAFLGTYLQSPATCARHGDKTPPS